MKKIVLSGTGIYNPPHSISNEELVSSFNQFIDGYNQQNPELEFPLKYSCPDFITKASGIEKRYVIDKAGILDVQRMRPKLEARSNTELSLQGEMAVNAAKAAIQEAQIDIHLIDAVLVACSNLQRPYPSIGVEVQKALGLRGFAFDMNAGCASATFAIQMAHDLIHHGSARAVLIVNPEICTGHVNFQDRDSHFIFGDAASAIIIQRGEDNKNPHAFNILGTQLKTEFSNNIRNNFGFLAPLESDPMVPGTIIDTATGTVPGTHDKFFTQQGRKVFKEVVPFVAETVANHLHSLSITKDSIKRLWLHQANANMNRLIATKILDREPLSSEAPTILHEFGNTSSPGAIIAFNRHHQDLSSKDIGILCGFGAGYSVGSVVLQKI